MKPPNSVRLCCLSFIAPTHWKVSSLADNASAFLLLAPGVESLVYHEHFHSTPVFPRRASICFGSLAKRHSHVASVLANALGSDASAAGRACLPGFGQQHVQQQYGAGHGDFRQRLDPSAFGWWIHLGVGHVRLCRGEVRRGSSSDA